LSDEAKHFVMVLLSDEQNAYAQMAAITVTALRRVEPGARVTILADKPTQTHVKDRVPLLADHVDAFVSLDPVGDSARSRSFGMKSRMLDVVDGPFVYLDVDVVPVAPLGRLFDLRGDVAGVLDLHIPPAEYNRSEWPDSAWDKLGWDRPSPFLNSGVLSFADTPARLRLAELWHGYWWQGHEIGHDEDQPSFNRAVQDAGVRVDLLPAGYNAQFNFVPRSVRGAKLLHFIYVKGIPPANEPTVFGRLVRQLYHDQTLNEALLDQLMRTRFPWVDRDFVGAQWAAGRYGAAAAALARKVRGKLPGMG